LHPYHAAGRSISFQRRDGCRVRSKEIGQERVVPVENDYSIVAEVDRSQVCWRKLSVSVPVTRDGILKHGSAPRIVCVKYGEVIGSGLTDSKRVLNGVSGDQSVVIRRETEG
jgi:hypothetical protein